MNKQETIERLCALVTKVGSQYYDSQEPHDCFCGVNKHGPEPIISSSIINKIESLVDDWIRDLQVRN